MPPSDMNSTIDQQPPPPVPPALQPPRSSFSCDRHPDENFTGFCPSCLCERLTVLDQSTNVSGAPSSSRRNSTSSSTAAAAIKSIFKASSSEANKSKTTTAITRNSLFPDLRRTKSFSASKNEGLGISAGVYEPQRKSCDVRGINNLWSLFSNHDENKPRHSYSQQGNNGVVLETNREDEEEGHEEDQILDDDDVEEEEAIWVTEELDAIIVNEVENNIVKEAVDSDEKEIVDDLKTMKDHIDLDSVNSQAKKPSRSNFWSAASVLSKKWHKWRKKQKKSVTGSNGVILSSTLPVEKPISRQYRETQSEIADYGFGRRSCDTDPRFSLDAGRISFDDPRYSFDEPRASWDGYMIGRTFPRLPPMVEDVPVVHVPRCDSQIPIEDLPIPTGDGDIPGGSIQTREYYLDSSSKRRKSLDRSNSIRRMAAAVVAELDETKVVSNTKVSPATIDYNNGVSIDPPRVSNSNSMRDDSSETFELRFRDKDNMIPIGGDKENKKPRKWRWKLWGFIHRRSKDDDEDRCSTVSGVGRSYSESWQDSRRDCNNEVNNGFNKKVFRSNSSVSWRSSSLRKSIPNNLNGKVIGNEQGFVNGKNRRTCDEFVLERNRSTRCSPNHVDNGLLRFYLGPLSGSRRSGMGISSVKNKAVSNPHLISRNMFGLY